jgi:hypothetical protein
MDARKHIQRPLWAEIASNTALYCLLASVGMSLLGLVASADQHEWMLSLLGITEGRSSSYYSLFVAIAACSIASIVYLGRRYPLQTAGAALSND